MAMQADELKLGVGQHRAHCAVSGRAHVQRQALLRDPPGHRAAQERLARVGDLGASKRGGVGAAAGSDVGLVEDIGGSAVTPG